jgi:hypothetical protein
MGYAQVSLVGAMVDALAFDFTAIALGASRVPSPWTRTSLPCFSLYYDADASGPVVLYQAPATPSDPEDQVIVLAASTQHAVRLCFPLWVDPATRVPFELYVTKPAGDAVLRVTWDISGGF